MGRALITTVLVAGLVLGAVWFFTRSETASMLSERIADNAPVGRCIATKEGWDDYIHAVPVVDCATEHWGEVLGYVPLAKPGTPYPGVDQTSALARFGCLQLLAQRGLAGAEYTASAAQPGANYWNDGKQFPKFENYAACTVNRIDNAPLRRVVLDVSSPPRTDVSVEMDLYSRRIWANPPIGSCVETKADRAADVHHVSIVACDRPHWAEVIGYPVLYESGSSFPGDDTVSQAARTACDTAVRNKGLQGVKININTPDASWWRLPDQRIYVVCTASRPNDEVFSGALG